MQNTNLDKRAVSQDKCVSQLIHPEVPKLRKISMSNWSFSLPAPFGNIQFE
jgi:hypothetical protein